MRGDFEVPGYQVEGLLGAGGTGEVWLATEDSSHRQVALKRLRLDPAAGADAVRRLVATLDALDHPHVLRIRRIDATRPNRSSSVITPSPEASVSSCGPVTGSTPVRP